MIPELSVVRLRSDQVLAIDRYVSGAVALTGHARRAGRDGQV